MALASASASFSYSKGRPNSAMMEWISTSCNPALPSTRITFPVGFLSSSRHSVNLTITFSLCSAPISSPRCTKMSLCIFLKSGTTKAKRGEISTRPTNSSRLRSMISNTRPSVLPVFPLTGNTITRTLSPSSACLRSASFTRISPSTASG